MYVKILDCIALHVVRGEAYGEAYERGATAPQLPPPRRDVQGAGVITPPRRDADGHGGLRAPWTRLPQSGTQVAPQIFAEARDQDVGVDRRNVPWSPKKF